MECLSENIFENEELLQLNIYKSSIGSEEEILEKNKGLVGSIANEAVGDYSIKSLKSAGIDHEDIIQVCNLAIIKAARTFDEEYNNKFSTYAYTVVKNSLIKYLNSVASSFEYRMHIQNRIDYMDEENEKETFSYGIKRINFDEEDPVGNHAVKKVMIEKLGYRFEKLPEREKRVLKKRYGIGEEEPMTIEKTAEHFHLKSCYMRRIENRGLMILREQMNDYKII